MDLYREVIALKPGSEEIESLRNAVRNGDKDAAKKYVYWCALENIRRDRYVPPKKKLPLFKELVQADLIEVSLG